MTIISATELIKVRFPAIVVVKDYKIQPIDSFPINGDANITMGTFETILEILKPSIE